MKTMIKPLVSTSIALLFFSISGSALALDYKVQAGNNCQINNQAATGLTYYSTGLYNGSGSTQWVSCPILRDNSTNTNGVYVRAAATTVGTCFMDNTDLDGTLGTWASLSTGANAYGAWRLHTTSSNATPYTLLCSVANGTRFTAYQVGEFEATDGGN